ncbi:MAG: membrane protein insertion efficiency factor YidD [Deltaproteobacteria bacterium]|nr:membrane protein insertion efficiency factor YidD [Deltaproteobacteria bacterium]
MAEQPLALAPGRRPIAWLLDRLVAGYQRAISPLLPPSCRFEPSCSRYARQALARHRLPRALWLIGHRLARCQPLCPGGHDPVPPGPWDPPAALHPEPGKHAQNAS